MMKGNDKKINIDPQVFEREFRPEELIDHVDAFMKTSSQSSSPPDSNEVISLDKGMFVVKTANEWIEDAKNTPIPKMLFDEFWYEGELCYLFADTNVGKSILGVQIGNSIATGLLIPGFRLEAPPQKVVYFDFELSDKQFESRYSLEFKDHFQFDDNFLRVEINPDMELPTKYRSFEDYLPYEMERIIKKTEAKTLLIDNNTYLKTETEKAKDALPLMKYLKALKKKYGLSILAMGHTPKRDSSKPLSKNDLSGSKMLMNLTDSSFAIGESASDMNVRYLKQIKVRYTAFKYDAQNVCVCKIGKPGNFLMFEFLKFGIEDDYLTGLVNTFQNVTSEKIAIFQQEGKSQRAIAKELGVSPMTISRKIKKGNENTSGKS